MANIKKFFIFQDGNDIMFVINVPPEQLDDSVLRTFKEEAHSRGLGEIMLPNVEQIIREAKQGEVVRIGGLKAQEEQAEGEEPEADKVEEEINLEDLPYQVVVSPDRMQAYLEMEDPSQTIRREHIDVGLEYLGIKYGVIEENIEKLLEEWPNVSRILIAKGTLPEDGADAELELVKEFKDNLAPEVTEEGFVDFKHLDLISPIEPGEVLQRRTPPSPGVAGSDVFGKPIPAKPGKDKKLQRGQNTRANEEKTELISTKGGFLHLSSRGEINVRPVYTVNGDVDYSTGNVEYKADVLVRGDVRAGFSVKAGENVHIYGAVEDAVIEAGGDIIVYGGVLSSGKAIIKAGGDVSVGFVQNATIEAGGSIFIRIESVGSKLIAGMDVEVIKHEGRIVGGELEVGGWVVAQVIGSENSPPLNIRFNGCFDASSDPDQRYDGSFVSTRQLESPIHIHFGKLMAKIWGIEPPLTISLRGRRIAIENIFIGSEQLKIRRREREKKEASED